MPIIGGRSSGRAILHRRDEQPRGVQRLQQIVAGIGQELGLAEVGALGLDLGLLQLARRCGGVRRPRDSKRLVQLLQGGGAFIDPALQLLLGRFQNALRTAPLGDVLDQREEADDLAAGVAMRHIGRKAEPRLAVGRRQRKIEHHRRARKRAVDIGLAQGVFGFAEHGPHLAAENVLAVAAERCAVGAVDELIVLLLVDVAHHRRHGVGEEPNALLAVVQRLLDQATLGDLGIGDDEAAIRHRIALDGEPSAIDRHFGRREAVAGHDERGRAQFRTPRAGR